MYLVDTFNAENPESEAFAALDNPKLYTANHPVSKDFYNKINQLKLFTTSA